MKTIFTLLLITFLWQSNAQTTVTVNTPNQLVNAVANATTPTTIVVADGVYGGNMTLENSSDTPICITAQNRNQARFHGTLTIQSDNITISNFKFEVRGAILLLNGAAYFKLFKNTWDDSRAPYWIKAPYGRNHGLEIAYNTFKNMTMNPNVRVGKGITLVNHVESREPATYHIHHNYFFNFPKGQRDNGYEAIAILAYDRDNNGYDYPAYDHNANPRFDDNSIIEHNLFNRVSGEQELISVKQDGAIIRHNTILSCRGEIVLRTSQNSVVHNNFIYHSSDLNRFYSAIRLNGVNNRITNNYISGIFHSNGSAISVNGGGHLYHASNNATVTGNYIANSTNGIAYGRGGRSVTGGVCANNTSENLHSPGNMIYLPSGENYHNVTFNNNSGTTNNVDMSRKLSMADVDVTIGAGVNVALCNSAPAETDQLDIEGGNICLEAEDGDITNMQTGDFYIKTTIGDQGTAEYTFDVDTAGTYAMKATVYAVNGGSDSFYYTIDNNPESTWDLNPSAAASAYNVWRIDDVTKRGNGTFDNPEMDPYTVYLTAGTHTLNLRGREPNAKIDEICFLRLNTADVTTQNLSNIQLFPNPVTNVLTILGNEKMNSIRIFNIAGQEVITEQPNVMEVTINTSSLSSGVYFVQIGVAEKTQFFKVIKQ